MRRICVVTGSRAEYGLLKNLIQKFLQLYLIEAVEHNVHFVVLETLMALELEEGVWIR